jgi:Mg-chelatase subunit ChlD
MKALTATDHRRRHTRLLAAVGLALFAGALATAVATNPAQADPATLAEMEKAAKIDEIPADYIILCDTSQSMRQANRYGALKDGLRKFLAALAPKDQVSLVTFDAKATVVYQGDVGESPDALLGKLPADANGQATDIGAAIEQAVRALDRPGTPEIATVVLITDGKHEPPAGAKYGLEQGYAWEQLRGTVSRLHQDVVSAYALPLAGSTGARLLGSVFPSATTLDPGPVDDVTRQLDKPKADVRAAKVRAAVSGDLKRGVSVSWPAGLSHVEAGNHELDITLRADTEKIPLTLTDLTVRLDATGATAHLGKDKVSLNPGESVTVPLVIDWAPGERGWEYRRPVDLTGAVTLTGRVDSPWSSTLAESLRLTFEPPALSANQDVAGTANLGRPEAWYGGGVAIVALVVAFLLWTRSHPRLRGVLAVTSLTREVHSVRLPRTRVSTTLRQPDTGALEPVRLRIRRTGKNKTLELTFGSGRRRKTKTLQSGQIIIVSSATYAWHADEAPVPTPTPAAAAPPTPVAPPAAQPPLPNLAPRPAPAKPLTVPADELPVADDPAVLFD